MSADIQRARDVLKKWRKKARGTVTYRGGNMELIVGTAGNPDLLDAIDRVLRLAYIEGGAFHEAAAPFAAAILAADERMSA